MFNKYLKEIIAIAVFLLIFFGTYYFSYKRGFNAGLASVESKVEYVPGPVIRDTFVQVVPKIEYVPSSPKYIYKTDTLVINKITYITQTVDTAAIIADYVVCREYREEWKHPNVGTLGISFQVEANRASNLAYQFQPVNKVETVAKQASYKKFRVMGGLGLYNLYSGQIQYSITNQFSVGYQYIDSYATEYKPLHFINLGFDF